MNVIFLNMHIVLIFNSSIHFLYFPCRFLRFPCRLNVFWFKVKTKYLLICFFTSYTFKGTRNSVTIQNDNPKEQNLRNMLGDTKLRQPKSVSSLRMTIAPWNLDYRIGRCDRQLLAIYVSFFVSFGPTVGGTLTLMIWLGGSNCQPKHLFRMLSVS